MPLPKIATPTYELELPSTGETIQYRPFLVKEEKILVIALESEDTKQITTAIKGVIKNNFQLLILSISFLTSVVSLLERRSRSTSSVPMMVRLRSLLKLILMIFMFRKMMNMIIKLR